MAVRERGLIIAAIGRLNPATAEHKTALDALAAVEAGNNVAFRTALHNNRAVLGNVDIPDSVRVDVLSNAAVDKIRKVAQISYIFNQISILDDVKLNTLLTQRGANLSLVKDKLIRIGIDQRVVNNIDDIQLNTIMRQINYLIKEREKNIFHIQTDGYFVDRNVVFGVNRGNDNIMRDEEVDRRVLAATAAATGITASLTPGGGTSSYQVVGLDKEDVIYAKAVYSIPSATPATPATQVVATIIQKKDGSVTDITPASKLDPESMAQQAVLQAQLLLRNYKKGSGQEISITRCSPEDLKNGRADMLYAALLALTQSPEFKGVRINPARGQARVENGSPWSLMKKDLVGDFIKDKLTRHFLKSDLETVKKEIVDHINGVDKYEHSFRTKALSELKPGREFTIKKGNDGEPEVTPTPLQP